jgi:starch synthase
VKIVLLTNEYPPHVYGGAGVHVHYLSRELSRAEGGRHEIQILCFGDQREQFGNLKAQGVRVNFDFPFQDPRHQKFLDTLFRNILMTGSLQGADIVHSHTWYPSLAGCLIKQVFDIPLVLTSHSLEPHRPWKSEQLGSAYRGTSWLERTAYENADGVIAVSPSMKTAVHHLYRVPIGRIRVIPNGIDTDVYRPAPNPEILSLYRIRPDKPFLLFVARLTRQKGLIHLVNAIQYLSPGIQAVLCAGAPDTPEIGEEIAQRVREARKEREDEIIWIEQWVPQAHLTSLYSHASVFVCPSIYEPFGLINLEAMACGTPVVASAVGGIPEVVIHGETGLLVPFEPRGEGDFEPKDPTKFSKDLADSINVLVGSPEKRKAMGLRAREKVEKHFTWESVARQTLEFYRKVKEEKEGEDGNPSFEVGRTPGGDTEIIEAIVEIPRGSRNKYEFDHVTGVIRLDRVLYSSIHYPTDYGFIPGTLAADGDPLDVLIIVEEPTFPGCRVRARPVGVLVMRDEKGIDEKILAVPLADPRFDGMEDLKDLQGHWLLEIENFFATYKTLERKKTRMEGWKGAAEARAVLKKYRLP